MVSLSVQPAAAVPIAAAAAAAAAVRRGRISGAACFLQQQQQEQQRRRQYALHALRANGWLRSSKGTRAAAGVVHLVCLLQQHQQQQAQQQQLHLLLMGLKSRDLKQRGEELPLQEKRPIRTVSCC